MSLISEAICFIPNLKQLDINVNTRIKNASLPYVTEFENWNKQKYKNVKFIE